MATRRPTKSKEKKPGVEVIFSPAGGSFAIGIHADNEIVTAGLRQFSEIDPNNTAAILGELAKVFAHMAEVARLAEKVI
jgi:hypothetical protein